jgi:hypothetical protein
MRRLHAIAAALGLATGIGFGPASADVVTAIATGTTTYDPAGQFGPLGSNISVTYVFDTTLGLYSTDAHSFVSVYGGTAHGVTSPSLGATVKTDARTITFAGTYNAQLLGFNNTPVGGLDSASTQLAEDSESSYVYADLHAMNTVLPDSITTPLSYSCQAGDTCVGSGYYNGSPFSFHEDNLSLTVVPVPNVGAGLPGVFAGCGLLAWWRSRRRCRVAVTGEVA